MFGLGVFLIAISIVALIMLIIEEGDSFSFLGFVAGVIFIAGIAILAIESQPTTQEICEKNNICYELVETVAEYTDYTELEVVQFFAIVSDDVEAWDAVKMIMNNPTDEQINAIMELSALKQAE